MDVDLEMLNWSQTVYGVGHALHVANSIKFGNLDTIVDSMQAAENWNSSLLGFASILPAKEFTPGSIKLDGVSHEEIFGRVSESIVRVLFVNLVVLTDEVMGYLIGLTGANVPEPVFSKVEWAKAHINHGFEWATSGLLEMVAIRNALVHNGGRWNGPSIEQLKLAGVAVVDSTVDISLSFGDLFRYRRALRTVVGELRKLTPPAAA